MCCHLSIASQVTHLFGSYRSSVLLTMLLFQGGEAAVRGLVLQAHTEPLFQDRSPHRGQHRCVPAAHPVIITFTPTSYQVAPVICFLHMERMKRTHNGKSWLPTCFITVNNQMDFIEIWYWECALNVGSNWWNINPCLKMELRNFQIFSKLNHTTEKWCMI